MKFIVTLYDSPLICDFFAIPEKDSVPLEKVHIYNRNAYCANIIIISDLLFLLISTTNATLNVSPVIGNIIAFLTV